MRRLLYQLILILFMISASTKESYLRTIIYKLDMQHDRDMSCIESPLGSDKVGMLTYTYSHKPQRKIKLPRCNHQAHGSLYVWPNLLV